MLKDYLLLFFSHAAAAACKRSLTARGLAVELQPTPRQLSAGCGIAAAVSFDGDYHDFIDDEAVEAIYQIEPDGSYTQLYVAP